MLFLAVPRLSPEVAYWIAANGDVVIAAGLERYRLPYTCIPVLDALNGIRSTAAILERCGNEIGYGEAIKFLLSLRAKGLLIEGQLTYQSRDEVPSGTLDHGSGDNGSLNESVCLRSSLVDDISPVLLTNNGIVLDEHAPAILWLTNNYSDSPPVEDGRPFLPIRVHPNFVTVGPLLGRDGVCERCFNLAISHGISRHSDSVRVIPPHSSRNALLTLAWAIFPLARQILCSPKRALTLFDKLLTITIPEFTFIHEPVDTGWLCDKCRDATKDAAWRIDSAPARAYSRLNGFRQVDASNALQRLGHTAQGVGAIIRINKRMVYPLDDVAPVYLAEHAPPSLHRNTGMRLKGLDYYALGKGKTAIDSEASACYEAIERYSTYWRSSTTGVEGSYDDLRSENAIHPNSIQLFSSEQFATREKWNSTCSQRHWIPIPFEENAAITWIKCLQHSSKQISYVPAGLIYFGCPSGADFFAPDSTGCAAGTTHLDAIIHGIFELIERDAVARWWHNRLHAPRINLIGAGDAWLSEAFNRMRDAFDLTVLDLTSDIGLPVIGAFAVSAQGEAYFGFGCHIDSLQAVSRALTELCQAVAVRYELGFGKAPHKMGEGVLAKPEWICGSATLCPIEFYESKALPAVGSSSETILDALVAILKQRGIDIHSVSIGIPHVDVSVYRVLAPGLRPLWTRLGGERLHLRGNQTECDERTGLNLDPLLP